MTTRNISFDELLEIIALEECDPTYDALCCWIERFPQHQSALSSFFATWAVQKEFADPANVDEDRIANRMVSRTLNQLFQRPVNKGPIASGETLFSVATRLKIGIADLIHRTSFDESILLKLDRRRIAGRIPRKCFEVLSTAIGLAVEEIRMLVTGPPLANAGSRHKSSKKPIAQTESFADAIKASSLSAECKEYWKKEIETEEKD